MTPILNKPLQRMKTEEIFLNLFCKASINQYPRPDTNTVLERKPLPEQSHQKNHKYNNLKLYPVIHKRLILFINNKTINISKCY